MENQTPSAELQARIDSERQRLLAEQNIERDLTGQRLAPLEAGDDEALDAVEASINACRDRQLRIQERLEILATRLDEAKQREETARLDGIRESAEKARERGIALIRNEYTRQAKALAKTLARLAAIDEYIESCNCTLQLHKQDPVNGPNSIRNRNVEHVPVTVRREVGLGEKAHPGYGKPLANQASWRHVVAGAANDLRSRMVTFKDGTSFPAFMEVEVEETQVIEGVFQNELWRDIVLPGATDSYGAFWEGSHAKSPQLMSELKAYEDVPEPPSAYIDEQEDADLYREIACSDSSGMTSEATNDE